MFITIVYEILNGLKFLLRHYEIDSKKTFGCKLKIYKIGFFTLSNSILLFSSLIKREF